jgi:hypothetical protein
VATESTQEYRELRELLDTGSAGGAATLEEAQRKQALMVFGGAAAVVLLVVIGLVAFPKDDDKSEASTKPADSTEESTEASATTTPPTTVAPLEAPPGTKAYPYAILTGKLLDGLKQGDYVAFYDGERLLAENLLILSISPEEEDAGFGFKQKRITIAATDAQIPILNDVDPGRRSMSGSSPPPG